MQSTVSAWLPDNEAIETKAVLRLLARARGALGELKGAAGSLPNQGILIDTLFLQEALASSEIEQVVTTQDEAFRAGLFAESASPEAKEVDRYRQTMRWGYDEWCKQNLITENMLIGMFRILKQRDDGYRTGSHTVLRNEQTGEDVYIPPQDCQEIVACMRNLEAFINEDLATASEDTAMSDPLVRMALIHHRFETIHPFPDGNGRIGRILNVLYLTHTGLLDIPILYLSRAIHQTRPDYYRLLQSVRNENAKNAWEEWVIYMLKAVFKTACDTLKLVEDIRELMQETKHRLRREFPKIYSQDLLNNLFRHPYTRIELLQKDIGKSRQTATSYLKQLTKAGFVREVRQGRSNYYINDPLVGLFVGVSAEDES